MANIQVSDLVRLATSPDNSDAFLIRHNNIDYKINYSNIKNDISNNAKTNIASDYYNKSQIDNKLESVKSLVGSPLVANSVSDMTDTSKVYVYVGSQSGYTNGNWYYYNGSSWVSGGAYNSTAVQTDTTLTNSNVAADAKAAGDTINKVEKYSNKISKNVNNTSLYGKSPWTYVPIEWEHGRIDTSNGNDIDVSTESDEVLQSRLRSGFIRVEDIDCVRVIQKSDYSINYAVVTYDANKNFIRAMSYYSDSNVPVNDRIFATPKQCNYIRFYVWSTPSNYALPDNVFERIHGLVSSGLYSEYNKEENKIYIPILFGYGNLYIENDLLKESNSLPLKRIRTGYIETSKVDKVYINRTDINYGVTLFYYNSIDENATPLNGAEYEEYFTVTAGGVPIVKENDNNKKYKYFRLCITPDNDNNPSELYSVEKVSSDITFFKEIDGPTESIKVSNEIQAMNDNVIYYYPNLRHRRTNNGALRPLSDLYTWGCSRINMIDYFDVSAIDYVKIEQTVIDNYSLFVNRYDKDMNFINSNKFYEQYKDYNFWTYNTPNAKYISFSMAPLNGNDSSIIIEKQFWYKNIHICKRIHSSKGVETGIIALNSTPDLMSKIAQLYQCCDTTSSTYIKPLVFAHFSDLHNNDTALSRIIDFCNEYSDYIDDIIHTGDCVGSTNQVSNFSKYEDDAKYILNVLGNHDTWAGTRDSTWDGWRYSDEADSYNRYMKEYISNWNVVYTENKCYWYKDYATQKIRLIALDNMHMHKRNTQTNEIELDTEQLQWFRNTLASARTNGYHVILANHTLMKIEDNMVYLDSGFDNPHYSHVVPTSLPNYPIEMDNAYITEINDFINNGGYVVCWICGHIHADALGVYNNNILNIAVTTAGDIGVGRTKDYRIPGTKSYDAFNLMGIDVNRKELKLVRIGMDYNSAMRHCDTLCWNYETHQLTTAFQTDVTLTHSGEAADAKAVGDKVAIIENRAESINTYFDSSRITNGIRYPLYFVRGGCSINVGQPISYTNTYRARTMREIPMYSQYFTVTLTSSLYNLLVYGIDSDNIVRYRSEWVANGETLTVKVDNSLKYGFLVKNALNDTTIINVTDAEKSVVLMCEKPFISSASEIASISTENTKNLFCVASPALFHGYAQKSTMKLVSADNIKSVYISCEPSTYYTVSLKRMTLRFNVATCSSIPKAGETVEQVIPDAFTNGTGGVWRSQLTILTKSTSQYLVVGLYGQSAEEEADPSFTLDDILSWLQIEKGSYRTPYHTYENAVDNAARHPSVAMDYPAYYEPYLSQKIHEIAELEDTLSESGDAFAFITDYHYKRNQQHSPALIRRIVHDTGVRFCIFGGDTVDKNDDKYETITIIKNTTTSLGGPDHMCYPVVGNHEFNGVANDESYAQNEISKSAVYQALYKNIEDKVCIDYGSLSYYIDNVTQKLRYYFLGCNRDSQILGDAVHWLGRSLSTLPSGYGIIVICHIGINANGELISKASHISNLLYAVENNASYQYDGITYDYHETPSDCYKICYFCGHIHQDVMAVDGNGLLFIGTDADFNLNMDYGRSQRDGMETGTVQEQAFDIVHIDIGNRKIYCTRIGHGYNREFSF